MPKRVFLGAGVLLLVAVAFGSGLAAGNYRAFRWMLLRLETEVAGSQNFRVAQLAYLRSGDIERAIQLLEVQVDATLSSLPQRHKWEELSPPVQNTLVLSKKYRELYPPEETSPSLEEALDFIPDLPLDPESCSPAVRHLLERGAS